VTQVAEHIPGKQKALSWNPSAPPPPEKRELNCSTFNMGKQKRTDKARHLKYKNKTEVIRWNQQEINTNSYHKHSRSAK
jgi:hypothetical protein